MAFPPGTLVGLVGLRVRPEKRNRRWRTRTQAAPEHFGHGEPERAGDLCEKLPVLLQHRGL